MKGKLNKPTLPKCTGCGRTANVQAAPRRDTLPGTDYSHRWICGDCLYLEEHPDAARIQREPRKKRRVQLEVTAGSGP